MMVYDWMMNLQWSYWALSLICVEFAMEYGNMALVAMEELRFEVGCSTLNDKGLVFFLMAGKSYCAGS